MENNTCPKCNSAQYNNNICAECGYIAEIPPILPNIIDDPAEGPLPADVSQPATPQSPIAPLMNENATIKPLYPYVYPTQFSKKSNRGLFALLAVFSVVIAVSILALLLFSQRPPEIDEIIEPAAVSTAAEIITTAAETVTTTSETKPAKTENVTTAATTSATTKTQRQLTTSAPDFIAEPIGTDNDYGYGYGYDYDDYDYDDYDDGTTLAEDIDYYDDGSVVAYSHLTNEDDYYAGFIIDYEPGKTLQVGFSTGGGALYDFYDSMVCIDLNTDNYGRTFIGNYYNGDWDEIGYLFWDYTDTECMIAQFVNGDVEGGAFHYDGEELFIKMFSDGEELMSGLTEKEADGDSVYWLLDGEKFYRTAPPSGENYGYSGTHMDGMDGMYGYYYKNDSKAAYRGETVDGEYYGMGILVTPDGEIQIGNFDENLPDDYGLLIKADGSCYFQNYDEGEVLFSKEIEGMKIDTGIFY